MKYPREKLEKLSQRWLTAKGRRLVKKIKETHCYLSPVLYKKVVQNFPYINDEEVAEEIDLRGINLAGFDFRVPVLEDESGFEEELAILSYIHFEGANLRHTTFQDGKIMDCHFDDADLSHSNFKNASINSCSFHGAKIESVLFIDTSVINSDFSKVKFGETNLGSILTDQASIFDERLENETTKNYHYASVEYKQLKDMYKNSSLHPQADEYHYREMVCRRKSSKWYNPVRWLNFVFGDLTCKYGTSPIRILLWMFGAIFGFTWIFYAFQNFMSYAAPIKMAFADCLYFSMVTYTTIGYGDIHPIGYLRFLAGFEGLVGITLTSLFTVIIARRIIRD